MPLGHPDAVLKSSIITRDALWVTPVTPKAFLSTVFVQLGPNPEAVLFLVEGGES